MSYAILQDNACEIIAFAKSIFSNSCTARNLYTNKTAANIEGVIPYMSYAILQDNSCEILTSAKSIPTDSYIVRDYYAGKTARIECV